MKLATTTADFSRYFSAAEAHKILPILKDCGFKYIDLSFYSCDDDITDEWERFADKIGNTAAKLGLSFIQAHSSNAVYETGEGCDRAIAIIKKQMKICQKLGIKGTVVHAIYRPNGTREDFYDKNTELYLELLKESEKTGVEIYTENTCTKNCPTYYLITADDFYVLKEKIGDNPYFGICWDIGHAHIEGINQYNEITALKDNLKAVHIHDNTASGDTHVMPFMGTISMDEIMNALIDVEFKGTFTMEAIDSLRPPIYWQGNRNSFNKDSRLANAPLELAIKMEEALYICGRHILNSYNCFDE